jgi:hypothetical protein
MHDGFLPYCSPLLYSKVRVSLLTGREGPQGYEMLRVPHYLDNRLKDGGKGVSLTHRAPFTPRKIPGTHFC